MSTALAEQEIENVYFKVFVDALEEEDVYLRESLSKADSRGQYQNWSHGAFILYETTMVYLALKKYLALKRDFELGWEERYANDRRWMDVALKRDGQLVAAMELKRWFYDDARDIKGEMDKLAKLPGHPPRYVLAFWHQEGDPRGNFARLRSQGMDLRGQRYFPSKFMTQQGLREGVMAFVLMRVHGCAELPLTTATGQGAHLPCQR